MCSDHYPRLGATSSCFKIRLKAACPVYTVRNLLPINCHHSVSKWRVSRATRSRTPGVVSALPVFLDSKAVGFPSCTSTAPTAHSEAPVTITSGLSGPEFWRLVVVSNASLSGWTACVWTLRQTRSESSLSSRNSGYALLLQFGISCTPPILRSRGPPPRLQLFRARSYSFDLLRSCLYTPPVQQQTLGN